MSRRVVW